MCTVVVVRVTAVGVAIATLAALHQAVQESAPLNDDFTHLALSRQLLGGDLPVRDFVDQGITLAYGLSAAAQALFGHRLLAEAIVVGIAFFVSTYLVFALVRTLTGSTLAAAGAALLLLLAGPRGYSYPKILVYAVAAALWWRYVLRPSRPAAVALGVWVAMAFYLRPDHGISVAAGALLAMVAVHGFRLPAATRGALSGAIAIALVLPYVMFVASTQNLVAYVRDGFAQGRTHHAVMDSHAWPRWPFHRLADVVHIAAAEVFAPVVSLRWADGAPPDTRRAVLERHQLTAVAADGEGTHVRLARTDTQAIVALINDAAVADTAGIDRSAASVASWSPPWNRWRFSHGWLRLRLLSGLDDLRGASHAAAALFYVLPVVAFVVVAPLRRRLAAPVTVAALAAFSVFALIVELGVLRTPYEVRAADGVVMPAILLGCIAGVGLTVAAGGGAARRVALNVAVAMLLLFAMKAVAVSGHFGHRVGWLAGDWRSVTRMRAAWSETARRLIASPPSRYWEGESGPPSVRLAQFAHACVPSSERLAVLWFAPEIYYYSDRLMALRHLVFVPELVSADERRLTAEKFTRFSPPVVFAPSTLSTHTRSVFPELVARVDRDYIQAASIDEADGYLVLVRRDRTAAGTWGRQRWPCFR